MLAVTLHKWLKYGMLQQKLRRIVSPANFFYFWALQIQSAALLHSVQRLSKGKNYFESDWLNYKWSQHKQALIESKRYPLVKTHKVFVLILVAETHRKNFPRTKEKLSIYYSIMNGKYSGSKGLLAL